MLARRCRVGLSRQHAGQLGHPVGVVEESNVGDRCVVVLQLLHREMGVGEGRDLRKMGDHQDLVAVAEGGQRPPDREARLPADPGVDLVEDQDRWGLRQHASQGQHRPGQLAARGHLGQRLEG